MRAVGLALGGLTCYLRVDLISSKTFKTGSECRWAPVSYYKTSTAGNKIYLALSTAQIRHIPYLNSLLCGYSVCNIRTSYVCRLPFIWKASRAPPRPSHRGHQVLTGAQPQSMEGARGAHVASGWWAVPESHHVLLFPGWGSEGLWLCDSRGAHPCAQHGLPQPRTGSVPLLARAHRITYRRRKSSQVRHPDLPESCYGLTSQLSAASEDERPEECFHSCYSVYYFIMCLELSKWHSPLFKSFQRSAVCSCREVPLPQSTFAACSPAWAPPAQHTNAAGPTAVSTFTPHCRHLAAMLRVLQQPCVVSNSEPLQNTPSPSISFLLLLQRLLSPGTCQFLALTHRNHPWQHSLHSQGSQQQVAKKTIE